MTDRAALASGRVDAVDALRGLAVLVLLAGELVTPALGCLPDSPVRSASLASLLPSIEGTLSAYDLALSTLLFLTGIATALSFARRRERGATNRVLLRRLLFRCGALFALGIACESTKAPVGFRLAPDGPFQLIAVGSLAVGALSFTMQRHAFAVLAVSLIAVQGLLSRFRPHTEVLPEMISAMALVSAGHYAATVFLTPTRQRLVAALWLGVIGIVAMNVGYAVSLLEHVDRSTSAILFSLACGCLLLAVFLALWDEWRLFSARSLLNILGRNALVALLVGEGLMRAELTRRLLAVAVAQSFSGAAVVIVIAAQFMLVCTVAWTLDRFGCSLTSSRGWSEHSALTSSKRDKALRTLAALSVCAAFAAGLLQLHREVPELVERNVVIHADDAGMCHSANFATIDALEQGCISSASIMVPCPGFDEFAAYARAHPEKDFGIHLTLTCDLPEAGWGPVSDPASVSSVVAPDGHLWPTIDEVSEHAVIHHAERELRAQIDLARRSGVQISHLDNHMLSLLARPDLLELYVRLSLEYDIPIRFPKHLSEQEASRLPDSVRQSMLEQVKNLYARGMPLFDAINTDTYLAAPTQKRTQFSKWLRGLPPGTSELVVHFADPKSDGTLPPGAAGRYAEYELILSPQFQTEMRRLGIRAIDWKDFRANTLAASEP